MLNVKLENGKIIQATSLGDALDKAHNLGLRILRIN